jgi:hypothetical protein
MQQAIVGGFEFDAAQNETIRALSGKMKFVGVFYVVMGVLVAVMGLFTLFMIPFAGIIYLLLTIPQVLIGLWTMNAASSFKMIVETTGNDVAHLNSALESLQKLYTLQFWMLVAAIVVFVLAFVIGLGAGVMAMMAME